MVRKHGWQLPAHKYQVVAITVFCLLVIAFYAFLFPFLGGPIWKYSLISIYTPVVVAVFILYVRCTAINPADPGIMAKFKPNLAKCSDANHEFSGSIPREENTAKAPNSSSPMSAVSGKKGAFEEMERGDHEMDPVNGEVPRGICGIFCALFVYEDCRKRDFESEQQLSGDDVLYCTLCNTEVRKMSKHCRSCDKCVDGFDHHCRWLNNCVGSKNYYTFISLMAASLLWLAIEAGVGIAVFVRCFADKRAMKSEIINNLGNGFSEAPFATVVGISTAVSVLACIPLGELFFFHMILIRKGISTYEYVVAMRAMSETPGENEELPNVTYSPTNSATTGFSAASSHALSYKGAWCTPPRIFVDYQDEVAPQLEPGMLPSTVDPDADRGNRGPKKQVRISAWKVAKLDSGEAVKAAAKARASSSVLIPVGNRQAGDFDRSSSENMSVRSSVSANRDQKSDSKVAAFEECDTVSSFSSPVREAVALSPLPDNHHQGFASTSGFKEKGMSAEPLFLPAPSSSLLRDIRRTSVVWDQEAGRYVSVPASASEARPKSVVQTARLKQSAGFADSLQQEEKLTYSGESIFYGGPMLKGQSRVGLNLPRDARYKRDATSKQLPVFLPASSLLNSSSEDTNNSFT